MILCLLASRGRVHVCETISKTQINKLQDNEKNHDDGSCCCNDCHNNNFMRQQYAQSKGAKMFALAVTVR